MIARNDGAARRDGLIWGAWCGLHRKWGEGCCWGGGGWVFRLGGGTNKKSPRSSRIVSTYTKLKGAVKSAVCTSKHTQW